MACTRWEQQGLLFTSGELDGQAHGEYAEHLKSCAECRDELSTYESEHRQLYTSAILSENTSDAMDREIIRVCGNARKRVTSIGFLTSLVLKPATLAVLFLMVGLGTGTYIAYNIDNSQHMTAQRSPTPAPAVHDSLHQPPVVQVASQGHTPDSLSRDSARAGAPFPRDRAGNSSDGVVPVDLQKR